MINATTASKLFQNALISLNMKTTLQTIGFDYSEWSRSQLSQLSFESKYVMSRTAVYYGSVMHQQSVAEQGQ